ncbi:ATP-binding cassette domain-containing protein [Lacipirellula limnantheis]|uniref:Uncharacterized protein n=1 Tax=Lacipirellula limnantheis TaxID=2528024 RepID=A0A517TYZ0_9BACT|nr:hypothetical protein [Lacipirellula limnantheis]QDT73588.1 hypothetical protein I41_27770 [Lacipirellula limnantheis]
MKAYVELSGAAEILSKSATHLSMIRSHTFDGLVCAECNAAIATRCLLPPMAMNQWSRAGRRAACAIVTHRLSAWTSHAAGVELVACAGELLGRRRTDALKRTHKTPDHMALGESRYRNVESYSTGMKQRLKLASALVHDPKRTQVLKRRRF